MIWFQQNWLWLLVGVLFMGMHLGHGSHGGHGGQRAQPPAPPRPDGERDPIPGADEPVRPTRHRH